ARAELAATSRFLTHLRDRGRTPATCRQMDIDAWLVDVRRADTTRAFWSWATRARHLPPLDTPTKASSEPSQLTPDDDRWALARRMLHNAAIPTADRVAALLDYARQLPPPVIGRLLGLAPGTVDRWATITGGKWARYTPPSPTRNR